MSPGLPHREGSRGLPFLNCCWEGVTDNSRRGLVPTRTCFANG